MKKILFVLLATALVITTTTCKKNDDSDGGGNGSYANIVDVWDGFGGAEGGAIPIVSLVVLDYRNKSSKTEIATVKVDWPNGTSSSGNIELRSTPRDIPSDVRLDEGFDCDLWCPEPFLFKGELSITAKVHMEFQGYISPIFEKVITMKNYGW